MKKRCTKCNKLKPLNEFRKRSTSPDGKQSQCKWCMDEYTRILFAEKYRTIDKIKQRQCSICWQWKSINEFGKNSASRDGLIAGCKTCMSERQRAKYRKENPVVKYLTYAQNHRTVDGVKQKCCRKCKNWKSTNEFYNNKWAKDGLDSQCRLCHQAYQQTHKIETAKRHKKWYQTIKGCLCACFHSMKGRCDNSKAKDYKHYGKRGIKCRFESSDELVNYVMGTLKVDPRGLQIHRIENDGHYEMGNIEFLPGDKHRQLHKKKG